MQVNYLAIVVATVVQFIIGFVWYGPVFGKLWGKIHGFDKLPKATQEKMMKQMGPYYAMQLVVTVVTSVVLSVMITSVTVWSPYVLASLIWLGFVVPAQVSSVIFGGTEPKWIPTKITLQSAASLLCLLAASFVISMM